MGKMFANNNNCIIQADTDEKINDGAVVENIISSSEKHQNLLKKYVCFF